MDLIKQMTASLFGGGGSQDKELKNVSDQSEDEKKLCSFVKNKIEECRTMPVRVANEGVWMTNTAYLIGYDSVYYDPTQRQFRPAGKSGNYLKRNRLHSNQLLPAAQNRLARMLKSPPRYDVRPNSEETEDKDGARLGIEVINMIWDKQAINRKRIELGMWLQQCGHSYVKTSFDDTLGEPLVDPYTDESIGYEGDIRVDIVSAFECFPDPLAKTMDECTWFAQAKVRKLDYFRNHYERGFLVKEEGAWLLSAQYELRINTLTSFGNQSDGNNVPMKNAAIELSYYEKPSKKYPNGRHIITANGVLLKDGELPCGVIPFVKFDDIIVAGKFYSESCITHARPLQDQYNNTIRKRAEWVNRLLGGKFIAARGHGLIQQALNDQSGEVVEYDVIPGAPEPHAMQIPTMPQYAYTEGESLKKEIGEIFGLSEFSQGRLPYAGIPAKGIELLLEQDETRIGIEVEQHEHAWAKVGEHILRHAACNYKTDRKLKKRGKNNEYLIEEFNGAALKNNFDVTVIRGSTVPNSKLLHRQEILNAFDRGLLGDPQDPSVREKVLGALEFGEIAEVWKDAALDNSQIARTIAQIEEGIRPVVNKLDNHAMHVLEKNRFRKSDKFEELSPEKKRMLIDDIMQHADMAVDLMNPELAHGPQMPPPPPSLGGPPVPEGPPGGVGDAASQIGNGGGFAAPPQ